MQRKIMASLGMLLLAFVVVACSAAATPVAEPTVPADAPVATEAPKIDAAPSSGAIEVPVQSPFVCPEGTATDASGALLISGCESISDIQTKYPGMDVLPNTVMMQYSAEATREGYYDSTVGSGLSDLATMCKFLQFHGDVYSGDQVSLATIGTGVDILGPNCATDNEYAQISVYQGTVSDSLRKIGKTLGLTDTDPIYAYETSTGLGYYVFWKLDPADGSRVIVSIISGGLGTR